MGFSIRNITVVDFSLPTLIRLTTIIGGYIIIRRYLVQIMAFLQKKQLEKPIVTTSSTSYITESELKRRAEYIPYGMERVQDTKLADGSSRAISATAIDAEEEYLNGAWGSRQRLKKKYESIQKQREYLNKREVVDMGEESEEELEGILEN
ncbi:hypothetical protein BJ508DRAFT_416115 [Ascobolus immersus RN42]|uniref:DUF1531-domain-containing protein n=1 Tax=Ascobolus immersus RN42 TaxID=1160509 RepID=A0A3N4I1C0_ASCIM|nr:hypothetical protein BJ508DRAFT_416115 [Ascobolus immersus RN42]